MSRVSRARLTVLQGNDKCLALFSWRGFPGHGFSPLAPGIAPCGPPPTRGVTLGPLEASRLGYLKKGIDLELLLKQWQVSRLEELEADRAQQVREWLKGQ